MQQVWRGQIAAANLNTTLGKNKVRLKRSVVSHVFCAVSTDHVEKNIFLPIFGGRFSPALHRRSGLMAPCLMLRETSLVGFWYPASGGMHSRRLIYRRVAQVGASEWHMRMWAAQVSGVDGAGGWGGWRRSDLMVGTCTAKRPRMAIPGAGQ